MITIDRIAEIAREVYKQSENGDEKDTISEFLIGLNDIRSHTLLTAAGIDAMYSTTFADPTKQDTILTFIHDVRLALIMHEIDYTTYSKALTNFSLITPDSSHDKTFKEFMKPDNKRIKTDGEMLLMLIILKATNKKITG